MRPPRSPRRLYRRCPPLFSSARPRSARREAGNRSGARRPRFPVALRGPGLTRVSPPSAAAGARGDDADASRPRRHHAAARPPAGHRGDTRRRPHPLDPLRPRDCGINHALSLGGTRLRGSRDRRAPPPRWTWAGGNREPHHRHRRAPPAAKGPRVTSQPRASAGHGVPTLCGAEPRPGLWGASPPPVPGTGHAFPAALCPHR